MLNTTSIYVDATPIQIGLIDLDQKQIEIFPCTNNILENEYLTAWLSHVLRPYALIISDNQAVIHFLARGRFPHSWRDNYKLIMLLMYTFNSPVFSYIKFESNITDALRRIGDIYNILGY